MLLSDYLSLIFQLNGRTRRWEAGRIGGGRGTRGGVREAEKKAREVRVLKRWEAGEIGGNYVTILIILQAKKG